MDPEKLPQALHGFLEECGLSLSRGDNGTLTISDPDGDEGSLSDFLNSTLIQHLVTHKSTMLDAIDANPEGEDPEEVYAACESDIEADVLCLSSQSRKPQWLDAVRGMVPRIVQNHWKLIADRAMRHGGTIPNKTVFLKTENARLRALVK